MSAKSGGWWRPDAICRRRRQSRGARPHHRAHSRDSSRPRASPRSTRRRCRSAPGSSRISTPSRPCSIEPGERGRAADVPPHLARIRHEEAARGGHAAHLSARACLPQRRPRIAAPSRIHAARVVSRRRHLSRPHGGLRGACCAPTLAAAGASAYRWQGRTADPAAPWDYVTVAEAFQRHCGIDVLASCADPERPASTSRRGGAAAGHRAACRR